MKKTTGNLPFEQQSAGKLLLTMCLPAVIIMVVMTVYHMTDLFFIGQLGDVTQLAAVSLVSPAIGIQSVFGTLIGGGGCAIIARRLGEKKGGEREIAGSCLLLSLISIPVLLSKYLMIIILSLIIAPYRGSLGK